MNEQTVEVLQLKNSNDLKPTKPVEFNNKIDIDSETHHQQNSITLVDHPGFEFFIRFTCCQALIFKSWVEASDQMTKKLPSVKRDSKNSKEIYALYIKTYEETFTNLFKSPEYALNLGKMINASMALIRNSKAISMKNRDFDSKYHSNNKVKIS